MSGAKEKLQPAGHAAACGTRDEVGAGFGQAAAEAGAAKAAAQAAAHAGPETGGGRGLGVRAFLGVLGLPALPFDIFWGGGFP